MGTTIKMWGRSIVRDKAHPAKVVTAPMARHVAASACLLDVDAAFWTWLCAHGLDLRDRFKILLFGGFAAASFRVPGTVAL
jgi:CelD/BcsL family acetyltransferase involved in cellulose biosynthesis